MAHACHAAGCNKLVPPRLLMCGRHWAMVPRAIQRAVWATYVKGQENRKDPTSAYMAAHHAAIAAVAKLEGRTKDAENHAKASAEYADG